jgi:hypothetical protein
LSEKLDNVRNWRTHSAIMRNAFAIDNDFRQDLNNDHSIGNKISYDIADGGIDSLQTHRDKHRNSDTRGGCIDDFITYHVAPELKIRPFTRGLLER